MKQGPFGEDPKGPYFVIRKYFNQPDTLARASSAFV